MAENPLYQDYDRMLTLLKHREDEIRDVYHEKELVDVVVKMSHKLRDHMSGMPITNQCILAYIFLPPPIY